MYYHIAVTKGEHEKKESAYYPYYELNIKKEKVEKIVREYIKKEPFLLKGTHIDLQEYPQMIIVQTRKAVHGFAEDRARALNPFPILMGPSGADKFFIERRDTKDDVTTSFIERMQKVVDEETHPKVRLADTDVVKNKKVFIVHGHDDELKESAARLVEKIGLEAVILHEQANEGLTIIQKLEKQADVGYAIILYTPCDEGRKKGSRNSKPRARQNVVFEHGLFMGKLGARRVCALRKSEVEMPSDAQGILYIEVKDGSNEWKHEVAKELKNAGYDVDLNKI
jgi:putative nucleotide-binding protein containing TIR-like domain